MAVGRKKLSTQILNQAIKTNFESVKDGTGLPLTQADAKGNTILDTPLNAIGAISDTVNTVSSAISNLAQSVTDIVSNIVTTAKEFLKPITNVISKVVNAVSGIVKKTLSTVMRAVGVPMKWLGKIFNKAIGFVKDLLSPIGASLKSKIGLRKDAIKNVFGNVSSIVSTATMMGLLFGKTHGKTDLERIVTSLKGSFSPKEIGKAIKTGLMKNVKMPDNYYGIFKYLEKDMSPSAQQEFRALMRNTQLDTRRPYDSNNLEDIFREFTERGLSKASGGDMSMLARNKKINKIISTNSVLNINKPFIEALQESNTRSVLTDKEKLTTLKFSSGLIDNQVKIKDPISEYMFNKEMDTVFSKQGVYDADKHYVDYTNQGLRYNQNQILGFNKYIESYKPSTRADLTLPNEIDQVSSTVAVNNLKIKDSISFTNFNGYTNKTNIIKEDTPPPAEPIAPQEDVTDVFKYRT